MSNIAFAETLNNFTFSLYGAIERNGNEFFSPFSITSALLLLMLGTDGTTKKQMMKSMGTDRIVDVDIGYKLLYDDLMNRTLSGITLSTANRLFGSQKETILSTYTTSAVKYYNSELEQLDIETQPEQSRIRINSWIASKTNNKIQDMFPPGAIRTGTVLVLVNAVYFKGMWQTQFDPKKTRKQNFYVGTNDQRQVDMMYGKTEVESGVNLELDCKIVKLPYQGGNLSMMFILPNAGDGLSELENKLNLTTFNDLLSSSLLQETIIDIPKFTYETKYDLKATLSMLGLTEIFDPAVADFSRMVAQPSKIYVSEARHNAFIDVNEDGSEAAVARILTTYGGNGSEPFVFRADHPFLFVIFDSESGTILFMGRYVEPKYLNNWP